MQSNLAAVFEMVGFCAMCLMCDFHSTLQRLKTGHLALMGVYTTVCVNWDTNVAQLAAPAGKSGARFA